MKAIDIISDIRARFPNGYTDERLITWINNVIQEVWEDIGKDAESIINLEPAKREYKLPKGVDFGGVLAVFVNGVEYTGKWKPQNSGNNIYFKAEDGVIGLHPMPSVRGEMRIFHICKPAEVETVNSEVDVREQFIEVVKNGVFCILAKAMGDAALANNYVADYNAALENAKKKRTTYSAAYPLVKDRQ